MGRIIVCGSIAYDNIMDFPGHFKEQILPDKIHALNVSFLVRGLKRVRGGTAPNIAYSLALVGEKPVVVGTAGKDFSEYREWLEENGVDISEIRIVEEDFTASCFITTDMDNNQITGFYPGAMSRDPEISIKDLKTEGISMAVIAPTEPAAMMKWACECRELGIPYLFDPGMQIPRLTAEELISGTLGARIAIFNNYEYDLMKKKTGLTEEAILEKVDILVETLGGQGANIRTREGKVHIPAARTTNVVDPTGAGDAFRAGLLKGYFEGASIEVMGRYACITGVYAVEHKGATEHKYTVEEFKKRYAENYGEI
jgi:adenosine kinase